MEKGQVGEPRTRTTEASPAWLKAVDLQRVTIHHRHRSIILADRLSYSGCTKAPRDHISIFVVYIHNMKASFAFAFLGSDES